MIEELISRVFAARDIAHRQHLRTKSYAEHQALGAFYDDVIDAVDAVAEAYQGAFGDIEDFQSKTQAVKNIRDYLTDEMDWIESNRAEISQGSDTIGNLLDTLTGVYAKCIFMLGLK